MLLLLCATPICAHSTLFCCWEQVNYQARNKHEQVIEHHSEPVILQIAYSAFTPFILRGDKAWTEYQM